jgi:hypothetical protein
MLAGAVAVLAVIPIAAQSKDSQPHETTTFRADTRLVVLHAAVVDKSGHLMMNLAQKAFRVFENGVVQPIKKFLREDVPVSMRLIVDNNGSIDTKRQEAEAAALALVKASNTQDEVFIVSFNEAAFLKQPLTGDIKALERGIARIDSIGGTAMRDAIRMSIDYLKENGKRDKAYKSTWNRRFAKGLLFGVAYNFSRSTDNGSAQRDVLPNAFDRSLQYGNSDFDHPHVAVVNVIYQLPFFKDSKTIMGRLLGDWQLSEVTQFQTGSPVSVQTGDDFAGVGPGSGNSGDANDGFSTRWLVNGNIAQTG